MSASLDEFPAPVTVSPGNAPAPASRAPTPLFRRILLTFGIFVGAALLASTLLELWLSYQTLPPLYSSLLRTAVLVLLGVSLTVLAGLVLGRRVAGAISALEHRLDERTTELGEAFLQQTATADVLKVISRSTFDLQAVLDALVLSAVRLCEAHDAVILLKEGEWLNLGAHHGPIPLDFTRRLLTRGWTAGRAVLDCEPIHIHDLRLAADEYPEGHDMSFRLGHRTIVSLPLMRANEAVGVLTIRRTEVKPFVEKQIDLLTTFADQAVIAIENARLFEEVRTRNRELGETLERQTATSEILRVISSSPTDAQPVFDTIAKSAARLCKANYCFVFEFDGELIHSVAYHGVTQEGIEAVKGPFPAAPDRGSITGRAVLSGSIEQVPDFFADPHYKLGDIAKFVDYRSGIAIPMMQNRRPVGVITLTRSQTGYLPDRLIELLQTFSEQAVIAVENVRLFTELEARNRDLNETLEQQTATAEILGEISRSPTDIQPVFDMIAQSAARLCEAQFCFVGDYDGTLVHFMAQHGLPAETVEALHRAYPLPPSKASVAARTVLSGRVEQIPDIDADADYELNQIDKRAYRSMLGVPILKDGRPVGAVVVGRAQTGVFAERQIRLLETFADQAVIAIENVRLFTEVQARNRDLNEALEQQTATADVLKVISRSAFDLQNVLDTLVQSAARLCEADMVSVTRQKADSTFHYHAANHGFSPEWTDYMQKFPLEPDRGTLIGRTLIEGRAVHIPDVLADTEYTANRAQSLGGFRTSLGVPLLREGSIIGVFLIARRVVKPFTEKQIDLVTTFADQAVIAIENVRLFDEVTARNSDLKEALEQQTATSEILRVISSSPTDIQPVFDTIAESAARLTKAQFCFVLRFDGELIHFVSSHGVSPEGIDAVRGHWPAAPGRQSTGSRAVFSGMIEQIPDVHLDPDYELGSTADIANYRSTVGVPMIRDGRAIGAIVVARSRTGLFPERHVELLKAFAGQAVIAVENVRLFTELEARNRELDEALQQQTATADVLKVISRSTFDLQAVLDTLVESSIRLCEAFDATIFLKDGESLQVKAHHGPITVDIPGWPISRRWVSGHAVLDGKPIHVHDLSAADEYPDGQMMALRMGERTIVAVPLLRGQEAIGALMIRRNEVNPFTNKQINLLMTFADQAVIAIENVRLFDEVTARNRELDEALQQQTATADVLKVISRSTFDLQAVLDTLVESSIRLCEADDATILLKESDVLRVEAHQGPIPVDFAKWPISRQWVSGRAVVDAKPIHVHDLAAADEYPDGQAMALRMGHRTTLAVPLLRGHDAIGALMIRRREVKPFTGKQINLLMTFADQAVIAIENVRLFDQVHARTRELTAALEQQTATSEILRAISMSPSSVQPVFETIVRNALPLCGSLFANVFRFDGELLHYVASHNTGPDFLELLKEKYPMRPDASQVAGRVILTRSVVQLENALEDRDYDQTFPVAMGWRRLLGVPMLREGEPLGVIVVGWAEAGPVPQRQEDLLMTFADQAVIAIENVRLFDQVQSRTRELAQSVEELRALGEVSQAVNSTLDLETVLNTIVAKAVQLSGTDAGSIYVLNKANTKFKLRATYGMAEATVAAIRHSSIRAGETAIGQATEQRQPLQIADVLEAPAAGVLDAVVQAGYRSFLIVPLLGPERAIGVLVIRRKVPGAFPDSTTDLLQTFAAQSVLAIQNARLFHEIEEKSQQLELASRHKSQFLANMSHELRTPLNAILGYSELVLDDIYGAVPDKARVALERVQSNGKHLLGLINDVLDLAKIEAGRLTLALADYSMDEVVASVVASVEALAAEKQLALNVELPAGLPIGHGDEQRIRQVLLNLVSNAIKFTDAGEVVIRASVANGDFNVSVSDTGPGISAEDQAKLFQDFHQADSSSTRKKGGTGLGLAISRRFIDLQGGRIWVDSAPGRGATFTFALPVTVELQEEPA